MAVTFDKIKIGEEYSRHELADLWGYSSFHAIARGVVTPADDTKIILFVTYEKQTSAEQYADRLEGKVLYWEGPNDHFGEDRMINATRAGEEIHVFYRSKHHTDFTYMGRAKVQSVERAISAPSRFVLRLND